MLESTWGATVSDKYSMAEVFGGANYCTACKSFHFEPIVVPEIVGCATRQPLTTGTGALLLSSLFPFVQLQPMIRYLTGDLFRIIPAGCNKPSFQFRGRMAHALFDYDNPDQVLLTGPDIVEAVDHIPEINRGSRFNDLMSVRYKQAAGEVRVKGVVSRSPARTTIDLVTELTFPPALFAERAAEIRSEVRQNLLVQSEYLADAVSNDRIALSVSLVGPGALAPMMKFAGLWVHQ